VRAIKTKIKLQKYESKFAYTKKKKCIYIWTMQPHQADESVAVWATSDCIV